MDDLPVHQLLREALALFNDRPNFGLRRDAGATSYKLAARIEAYLASRSCPSEDLLAVARRQLGDQVCLRFDPPPHHAAETWVPAWIRCAADASAPMLIGRLQRAVAALPPLTRQVYFALRDTGLEYPAIASEFGITASEVEAHVASALIALDLAVHGPDAGNAPDDPAEAP